MLVDRASELAALQAVWRRAEEGTPQMAVLWGRRRVGKTFLLSELARSRPAVFFAATRQAQAVELARLHELVGESLGSEAGDLAGGAFADWERALRYFVALARQRPVLLVIDEAPYLAASTPGFASVVQAVWDHVEPGTRLMLVLTGSAIGTMEQMLSGPLHERASLTMRMDPLRPDQAALFQPDLGPEGLMEAYSACGGYPLHLAAWDPGEGTSDNLLRLAGRPAGVLLEGANSILGEEITEPGYIRVLAAVGAGATRHSEISSQTGQRIDRPLEVLLRTGFLRRQTPLGAPRAANPTYEIADAYLSFWFTVLFSDYGLIEGGQGQAVLRRVESRWNFHVQRCFEEAARQHAARLVREGRLPGDVVVGRWWATSGPQCEVDVLGMRGGRTVLVGEAKWRQAPVSVADLPNLYRKLPHVPDPIDDPVLALYGRAVDRTGLDAHPNVMLFDADDVLRPAGE